MTNKQIFDGMFHFLKSSIPQSAIFQCANTNIQLSEAMQKNGDFKGEFSFNTVDGPILRNQFAISPEKYADEDERYAHYLFALKAFMTKIVHMAVKHHTASQIPQS